MDFCTVRMGTLDLYNRFSGALVRAVLVVILIIMPTLLLPRGTQDSFQMLTLVAIFAAIFTVVEYSSNSPSLIEFRDAPPFNRVRFFTLFATVLCLAVIFRGYMLPSPLTDFFQNIGSSIGQAIDFPYSPVRLMVLLLHDDSSPATVLRLRDAAGLSYVVSILAIAWFVILLRVQQWPMGNGPFNLWVNLPTFDPAAGGDVVERLERDGRINVVLGFLLPFLVPAVLKLAANLGVPVRLDDTQTLIWMVTAWAFLPASILMRGVALSRVAQMIRQQRAMSYDSSASSGAVSL